MILTIKNGLSLLLVLQLLIASVGLPIYSHTCEVMGLTELSVFDNDGCCSDKEAKPSSSTTTDADDCCDLSVDQVDAGLDAVLSSILDLSFNVFTFFEAVNMPEWPSLAITEGIFIHYTDSSPPRLHGRALLQFIQIFLI